MDDQPDDLTPAELLAWIEMGCWMALVMAPVIYWLQGPSVSTDQFVVRTALVIIAAVGGAGLRIRAIVLRRRSAAGDRADPGPPPASNPRDADG